MKICRNCGQQYPDETKFCVHCGKPLEAVGGGEAGNGYAPGGTAGAGPGTRPVPGPGPTPGPGPMPGPGEAPGSVPGPGPAPRPGLGPAPGSVPGSGPRLGPVPEPGPAPRPTPPPPRPTPPPPPRPAPPPQKSGGIFESLREYRIVPYILFALSLYFGWGVSLLLGLVVGIVDILVTKDGNDKLALVLAGCATAFNLLFYIIL